VQLGVPSEQAISRIGGFLLQIGVGFALHISPGNKIISCISGHEDKGVNIYNLARSKEMRTVITKYNPHSS
jgi:hypothetical protein